MSPVLDFTDCKTVEDVNAKWLEYAKDMEPWKTFFKKLLGEACNGECENCKNLKKCLEEFYKETDKDMAD